VQAKGFLTYRLKYCWPKVFYCICQPNELERETKKTTGGHADGQAKIWGAMAHQGCHYPQISSVPCHFMLWETVSVQKKILLLAYR